MSRFSMELYNKSSMVAESVLFDDDEESEGAEVDELAVRLPMTK